MTADHDGAREVLARWTTMSGPDECWPCNATRNSSGYPQIAIKRHSRSAHRVAYEVAKGPIPDGLTIDHLCRNKVCVNPAHLEAVTHWENNRRGGSASAVNARKTHCPAGHALDEANTLVNAKGHRKCRECDPIRGRRYRAEQREARRNVQVRAQ